MTNVARVLLDVDFGRPTERTAEIHFYTRCDVKPDTVEVVPAPGWHVDDMDASLSVVEGARLGRAVLSAQGTTFIPGSPVEVIARLGTITESREISLTSAALTTWSLLGPLRVESGDGLDALAAIDAALSTGGDHAPQDWRVHPGLACSEYVNLTAFLENLYGPIPSGDYPIYRRLAYARTHIHCQTTRAARLALRGEDRFRIWWNGEQCVHAAAPMASWCICPVTLRAGWNLLVVKSTQDGCREWGGRRWGMECRLQDDRDAPLRGLTVDALRRGRS